MPGPMRFPRMHIAESIQNRIRNISDEIDERLAIQESFDATAHIPGTYGGAGDRARHMYWMQALTEKYGPNVARAIGAAHEVEGVGRVIVDAVTGKEPLREGLDSVWSDLLTNETAVQFAPRDDAGNYLPPNIEDIEKAVSGLEADAEGRAVAATPLNIFKGQQSD